jgi:AraC family transcriptional regulator
MQNPHHTDFGKGLRRTSSMIGEVFIKRVPANLLVTRHEHECAHLSILLDGFAEEYWPHKTVDRTRKMVTLHPAGSPHAMQFHKAASTSLVIELSESCHQQKIDRTAQESHATQHWATRIASAAIINDKLELDEAILALLDELTNKSSASSKIPARWLRDVHEAVTETVDSAPALEALARTAGVDPAHLARTFRQHYGITIGTASRRARLAHARTLLLNRDIPIAEVATEAGFADQSHMGRWFRREYSVTPQRLSGAFDPIQIYQ